MDKERLKKSCFKDGQGNTLKNRVLRMDKEIL